jgi:hypothetical protein
MSARESIQERALRYISENRLTVTWVDHERIDATCQGTGAVWTLGYRRGGWFCSCPAADHGARCSHLDALQRVCRRPVRQPAGLTAERLRREQAEANRVRNGTTRRTA